MKPFRSILYVAQPSVEHGAALARAVSLAENNQAHLTVVDVVPPFPVGMGPLPGVRGPAPADLPARLTADRHRALESLVAPYRERLPIRTELRSGKPFLEAIRAVVREGHDLLIKQAEDPDLVERLFGSDDMHLLRKCPCPLWLMKPGEKSNYQRILSAVDFDPDEPDPARQGPNVEILELSSSLAVSDFAELHLVHAWDAPAEMLLRSWSDNPDAAIAQYVEAERSRHRAGMDAFQQRLRERLGAEAYEYLAPRYHLIQGTAKQVIPQTAERLGADLVVMGTLARSGVSGFLIGNTAESILDRLRCSVLAVKPPGFISPVTTAN